MYLPICAVLYRTGLEFPTGSLTVRLPGMGKLNGRRVLVGITGGIAAYKSVELTRRLREHGAEVRVVLTPAAKEFITPLTLQATSGNPVHESLLDSDAEAGMGHIELARWPDQVIIAPASADFIARLAAGLADTLLSTICLATEAPVAIAPAMNRAMWDKAVTRRNVATLESWGAHILGPDSGEQACGETGPGRMLEPGEIVSILARSNPVGVLQDLQVLVTAGPTWEALDPVRALTNHSSGKMGYAVASAAVSAGATVSLVSGPTALEPPAMVSTRQVVSAEEMLSAVEADVDSADILISVAAVADYRPAEIQPGKIKKDASDLTLELVRNPDILAAVAARPSPPFTVGFAAETERPAEQAREKLIRKKVDLMVANLVGGEDDPFGSDQNSLVLVDNDGETALGRDTKVRLAKTLIEEVAARYHAKNPAANP